MQRFLHIYGRTLGFLANHWRAATALCLANLGLAAIGFLEPMLFGRVIQALSEGRPAASILLIWAALGFAGIAASMATSLLADRLAHRLRLNVMGRAYAHVLRLSPATYARHANGGLLKTLWTGTDEMFAIWLGLFREYLGTVLCLIGLLPVAMFVNPILGSVLVVLAVVFSATALTTLRRTQGGQRRAENAHTALASQVSDVLGHARLVQAFGAVARETATFSGLAQNVLRHQLPVLSWWAGMTVMSRGASTVATVTILALGAWLHGEGRASMADVVTFMAFGGMLIGRLDGALTTLSRLGASLPRLEDFFALLDTPSAVADPPGRPDLQIRGGAVAFEGVRFAYPDGPPVLKGVDFTVRAGETVALVGATGSGKSTAMSLLQRLWDPADGTVRIDGCDIRGVNLRSLQDRIGIVPQETMLLNRSIRENLLIGKPNATDDELEHAARLAEAHEFITEQPAGYDTVVGERGVALSGGQRQRLAIARALLRDPRILILDEATSALDGLTEEKVVRAMRAASVGRTTFVIAHRLATIRDADRILLFAGGIVAESGRFEELVARGGPFAALAHTQFPTESGAAVRPAERMAGVGGRPRLVYSRPEAMDRASDPARVNAS
jgi:ATP-binding cassette subfamily B protein